MPRAYSLPPGVGSDLKMLREQSQLSQKDVQRTSGLDQSRISRIEKGEIAPTNADVNAFLSAVRAPLAKKYKDYLRIEWRHLSQPPFAHPDLDALVRAERCLNQIDGAFPDEEERSPIRRQLELYRAGLLRLGKFLQSLEHTVALIGPIGVGKSTVISHMTSLVAPSQAGLMDRCALEVAGGRTTLCEVQIKPSDGSRMGIVIDPQTEEELHSLVGDLCAGLVEMPTLTSDDQRRGVPAETETALRNMAGLRRKTTVGPDKKRIQVDPLRELATNARARDELRTEFCTRMNLPRRARRELWFDGSGGQPDIEWLKRTFSDVNRGRIDDVPLPRRIDVLVPRKVFDTQFDVTVVDTKGIDDAASAIRPDLELRLMDPRAVNILCSWFPDAPNAIVQQLLHHLSDVGETAALRERVVVLVLPQNQQALDAMEDGARVESKEHGYEVKERDAIDQLRRLGFNSPPPFIFYDALADDSAALVTAVNGQIRRLRDSYVEQIAKIHENISVLLADEERARAVAAQAQVLDQLAIFIDRHEVMPQRSRRAHVELVRVIREVIHHSVLWASTRRRGRYSSFNVYFRLGGMVAADARERSSRFFHGLEELHAQWKADPALEGASGLLDSLANQLEFWRSRFFDACRRAGEETFRPALLDPSEHADALWNKAESLYGKRLPYRALVADAFNDWFEHADRDDVHDGLEKRVRSAWEDEVIQPLRRLCQPEGAFAHEALH
ncbi:helix-turn-helix domain-containing protein [Sorangium sp. So ce1151]|uniref:helix-turn-helix domain-containing protein n=1 Tax=Sorangium sp. So ce1151 TaxID=3133332 RepID=UPI003F63BDCA